MTSFPIAHLGPLAVGLVCAVVTDVTRRRVPNVISAGVLVTGIAVTWYDHGFLTALGGLAAAAVLILALFAPWRAGGIGGGDVKLAAAVAAWVGLPHLIWFVLVTGVAGGAVAALYYLLARAPTRTEVRTNLVLAGLQGELPPVPSHRSGHPSVPYAVAIAAGAAVALLVG
jgi:prepilin peptidase CpaA